MVVSLRRVVLPAEVGLEGDLVGKALGDLLFADLDFPVPDSPLDVIHLLLQSFSDLVLGLLLLLHVLPEVAGDVLVLQTGHQALVEQVLGVKRELAVLNELPEHAAGLRGDGAEVLDAVGFLHLVERAGETLGTGGFGGCSEELVVLADVFEFGLEVRFCSFRGKAEVVDAVRVAGHQLFHHRQQLRFALFQLMAETQPLEFGLELVQGQEEAAGQLGNPFAVLQVGEGLFDYVAHRITVVFNNFIMEQGA